MGRFRGMAGPPPEFPIVLCVACQRKRRVGKAVSICTWCHDEVCMKHLDGCRCFTDGQQLSLVKGVA